MGAVGLKMVMISGDEDETMVLALGSQIVITVVVCIAKQMDCRNIGISGGVIELIGSSCTMRCENMRRYTPQSCPLDCMGTVGHWNDHVDMLNTVLVTMASSARYRWMILR